MYIHTYIHLYIYIYTYISWSRIWPKCVCTQLVLGPYSFFVFCCWRRGVSRRKHCSTAVKHPRSQPVSLRVFYITLDNLANSNFPIFTHGKTEARRWVWLAFLTQYDRTKNIHTGPQPLFCLCRNGASHFHREKLWVVFSLLSFCASLIR